MPQKEIDQKSRKLFFETIDKLRPAEFVELVESLMSSPEIKDVSRRLMVAKLLKENYIYEDIVEIMGMSESTIGKIHAKTHGSPIINELFSSK